MTRYGLLPVIFESLGDAPGGEWTALPEFGSAAMAASADQMLRPRELLRNCDVAARFVDRYPSTLMGMLNLSTAVVLMLSSVEPTMYASTQSKRLRKFWSVKLPSGGW